MNLYELTEIYQNLLNLDLEEEDLQVRLKNINDAIETKAKNIAEVLRDSNAEAEAYKEETERMTPKKQRVENKMKNLKSYLEEAMKDVNK